MPLRAKKVYPAQFVYEQPASIEEAVALLDRYKEDARPLAGGMSLVPLMKLRLIQPQYIVDISKIKELRGIRKTSSHVEIGAITTNSEIQDTDWLLSEFPLIRDTVHLIGDVQVRNLGTIGGNISDADPSLDWLPTLIALESDIVIRGVKGERTVAAGDFLVEPYTTVLAPDELVTSIRIPLPKGKTHGAHIKIERRTGDFAVAIAACQLTLDGSGKCSKARIVIGAVSPLPVRAVSTEKELAGKVLNESTIASAAEKSKNDLEGADILSDVKATAEYRTAMVPVIVKRSIISAVTGQSTEGKSGAHRD